MFRSRLDQEIDRLTESLERCGNKAIALHSAACGERLINIYFAFVRKENRGSKEIVRKALDTAWLCLEGTITDRDSLIAYISYLEAATPHADDCKSVECLLAPYVCVCIDTSIRYCMDDDSVGPVAIEYSFLALRSLECYRKTGFVDLGSGLEAERFEERLIGFETIRNELAMQQKDLSDIQDASAISKDLVNRIKRRAKANRLVISESK